LLTKANDLHKAKGFLLHLYVGNFLHWAVIVCGSFGGLKHSCVILKSSVKDLMLC